MQHFQNQDTRWDGPSREIDKAMADKLYKLALGFMVSADTPLDTMQDSNMMGMLKMLNPQLLKAVPMSEEIITERLQAVYYEAEEVVRRELGEAATSIHLSFECWRFPHLHTFSFVGIVGHYLDAKYMYQARLLGIKSHEGNPTSIAEAIERVVKFWGIEKDIGVTITDNSSNNDTYVDKLFASLCPEMTEQDRKHRRLRCVGDVIHLVVHVFLANVGSNASSCMDIDGIGKTINYDKAAVQWHLYGPVGKLHNIIRFARHERLGTFQKVVPEPDELPDGKTFKLCSDDPELYQEDTTWWNCMFLMLRRAVLLRENITQYIARNQNLPNEYARIPKEDVLTEFDWEILTTILRILTPMYSVTKHFEGNNSVNSGKGELFEIQPTLKSLLQHIDKCMEEFKPADTNESTNTQQPTGRGRKRKQDDDEVAATTDSSKADAGVIIYGSLDKAREKLKECDGLLDSTPFNAASIILHPQMKLEGLRVCWAGSPEERLGCAEKQVTDYFNKWYVSKAPAPAVTEAGDSGGFVGDDDDIVSKWMAETVARTASAVAVNNELQRYLKLERCNVASTVQWWVAHRPDFPTLSKFALDILAIPAMVGDCERIFSTALVRQDADLFEKVQLLKDWEKRGVYDFMN